MILECKYIVPGPPNKLWYNVNPFSVIVLPIHKLYHSISITLNTDDAGLL